MLSIQEVGREILTGNPRKFYAMCGPEYGIKSSYIKELASYYGDMKSVERVDDVLKLMSMKHLFPPQPCVYVVRYDEEFISELDKDTQAIIDQTNIIGCVVCLYVSDKDENKLAKYIPDYTVRINNVDKRFIAKYLHMDYPMLPDKLIDQVADICVDYGHARNIAGALMFSDIPTMFNMPPQKLASTFGVNRVTGDDQIRLGVASRNFNYLWKALDAYEDNLDSAIYTILSTLIEIEKLLCNSYTQSDIREYVKLWNKQNVYNMFMQTYSQLEKLRTISSDTEAALIYLFALLQFSDIPGIEVM